MKYTDFRYKTLTQSILQTIFPYFYICVLLCCTIFFVSSSFASSYVYVKTGNELNLSIGNEREKDSSVSWVISQNGEILDTVSHEKFSYVFSEAGIFEIMVNETSKNGDVKSTIVTVDVQEKIPSFSPLKAELKTIPPIIDGVVTLSGKSQEVVFSFSESTGAIKTYALESNIFEDSDGDGITENDIDNKNDPSFLSGTYFKKIYENTGIPSRAILTIADENGNTMTDSVTLMFDEESKDLQSLPLSLIVSFLPQSNDSGVIHLSQGENVGIVYAGRSTGKILYYKIDENLEVDSDNDGDATNDFDNKGTDSELTGSGFSISLVEGKESQKFSVSIVGDNTSKVEEYMLQKFSGESLDNQGGEPLLFASRAKIIAGESVAFSLFNVSDLAKISWDFDGDGVFEIEDSHQQKVEYLYAQEGSFSVIVAVQDEKGVSNTYRKSITVFDKSKGQFKTNPPFAHFLSQSDGNKVSFISSQSRADENLANTDLSYSWDFGDGFKSQGPNAVHVYEKSGTYTVFLTVEDSIERTGIYTENVIISEVNTEFTNNQHGEVIKKGDEKKEDENLEGNVSGLDDPVYAKDLIPVTTNPTPSSENTNNEVNAEKINQEGFSWWIVILVLFLLSPFLYLLKKKIDNPEQDIADIVKNIKEKFGAKKSIEDLEKELKSIPEELQKIDAGSDHVQEEEQEEVEQEDVSDSEENTPDWMREYNEDENAHESDVVNENEIREVNEGENIPELENIEEMQDVQEGQEIEEIEEMQEDVESVQDLDVSPVIEPETINAPETLELDDPFEISHPDWLEDVKRGESIEEESEEIPEAQEEQEIQELPIGEEATAEVIPEWIDEPQDLVQSAPQEESIDALPEWMTDSDSIDNQISGEQVEVQEVQKQEVDSEVLEQSVSKKKRKRRKKKKNMQDPVFIEKPIIAATNAVVSDASVENSGKIPEWLK